MAALIISGITAMPAETELRWLMQYKNMLPDFLGNWLQLCYTALMDTNAKYPFLAFAHIIIALSFIGLFKDPVRNIWIIDWQIITCILVVPLAFIAGPIRQIPIFHIVIDCCFGIFGIIPLVICKRWINKLAATS